MKAFITVRRKQGVLDPEANAIKHALSALGFPTVEEVQQSRTFEVKLAESDPTLVEALAKRMAESLLANTVIETHDVEVRAI